MRFVKEILPYVIIILIAILIRTFIITPVQVDGSSMNPTLQDNQVLLLKKYSKKYKRFDIIVIDLGDTKLVKRVIGLPNEHLAYIDNRLYIDGNEVADVKLDVETADFDIKNIGLNKIPEDCFFVMGDNRNNSTDSRNIGVICNDKILGKTNFSIFPFNRFGKFN